MIKNILFDMGGVVFNQDSNCAFARFSAAGIHTARFMGHYGQQGFFHDLERGAISPEHFVEEMEHTTGRQLSFQDVQHLWLGFIADVPVSRLRALESLRSDYRLCLLSNTNPLHHGLYRQPAVLAPRPSHLALLRRALSELRAAGVQT